MGRKAKANKTQSMQQPLEPTSPLHEQTSATDAIPINVETGPHVSGTSHTGKKKSKTSASIVRRSRRLHTNVGNQELEPITQEIRICESENDEEDEPPVNELNKSPETSVETERNSEKENPGVADIKYKTMYINSQKKIEGLMEKNRELNKALEHAIGKIDVYEKQSNVYSEVMDVIASLSKVNENLSAHVKRGSSFYNGEDGVKSLKKNRTERS